jgi:hypothetical protein
MKNAAALLSRTRVKSRRSKARQAAPPHPGSLAFSWLIRMITSPSFRRISRWYAHLSLLGRNFRRRTVLIEVDVGK